MMLFGFGISAVNPIFGWPGEPFVAPTVSYWEVAVWDAPAVVTVDFSGITVAPLCSVKWTLKNNKKIYSADWTSPEQSSPQAGQVTISTVADRGLWYDLYWRWNVGSRYAPADILILANAVYIPTAGEGDGNYHS